MLHRPCHHSIKFWIWFHGPRSLLPSTAVLHAHLRYCTVAKRHLGIEVQHGAQPLDKANAPLVPRRIKSNERLDPVLQVPVAIIRFVRLVIHAALLFATTRGPPVAMSK